MSAAEKCEETSTFKQPRIFVVGTGIENLIFFVSVATKKYYAKTILEAVEIAMFFYLGLDLKYPCESETVWEFLQQMIFCVPVTHVGQQLQDLIQTHGKT